MDEERFKLDKINIIILIIDVLLFILVVISFIFLAKSFGNESELPNLEVTKDRTSTISPKTTMTTTMSTTTTTTRKNLNSPYYNLNTNDILTSELLTKQNLNKDEALEVMNTLFDIGSKITNLTDNSLLDIATTIEYAKDDEIDKITVDNINYGIIYDGNALFKKCFTNNFIYNLSNNKLNGNSIFKVQKGNYYRMENKLGNIELVLINKELDLLSPSLLRENIVYYKSNYKEEGFTAPAYKKFTFEAFYENGRWKISEFNFPLLD